ncbi:MAG TPA: hypothetical protein VK741_06355 [Acetobacteraceae bacterium]|jgi:hypothetical protein|nr:hypothetical protein [Acetobacteraceae bacterium]
MKTLFLASALALSVGMSAAFASVTIFSDGSTYDSAAPTAPTKYASNSRLVMSDATMSRKANAVKVVRFGPPESGIGGG